MEAMQRTLARLAAACLLTGLIGCAKPTPPEGEARGPALFETCAACHGADGGGMQEFEAPAIAGLPEWYLLGQLGKFQSGARGTHADDANGLRMRGMARTLNHDGDVEAVAAYVASLPVQTPSSDLEGDPEHGRELFATCVECHGEDAAGDESRGAPPLTGLDDWYIVSQLQLFKAGIRGTNPQDETGATMRPMALGLADEQAMRDVAAYIRTLRGG
jgi:cytochrome c oxidase subunit 2